MTQDDITVEHLKPNWEYITEQSELEKIIPVVMAGQAWGVDCETTGLDPHSNEVTLLQIGDTTRQYIIDTRKVNPEPLRPFFDSEIKKIGHNLKFDYKMLKANHSLEIETCRDTMLAEKIIHNGRKMRGFGLDDCLNAYLRVEVDKTLQKSFIGHRGDFSDDQLGYAARDVMYLKPLCALQCKELKADGLGVTWGLECMFLPCLGDMELYGLKLDEEMWRDNIKRHTEEAEKLRREMDPIASQFFSEDMFGNVDVNYDSSTQMLKMLRGLGVKIEQYNKVTKQTEKILVPNTDAQTLKKAEGYPIIKTLQAYRGHVKKITTYGQTFIDAIHPKTGRIHPIFHQLGTETGRLASAKDSPVNMLNIPRDKEYRHAFVAQDPDWLVETDDYSGCELRILAELSGDPGLVEPLLAGEDLHCSVATKLYGVEVTKTNENKHYRTPAKNLNFGIAYGMGPTRLYWEVKDQGFEITPKESRQLFKRYEEEYHIAVKFLRDAGVKGLREGYLTNFNGRRRYWLKPNPENHDVFPMGAKDQKYIGVLEKIKREGGNFLVQSGNVEITKLSMVKLRDHIKKNNVRSHFINQVYDEVVTTTHKDDSEQFVIDKRRIMQEAGEQWIKKVPIDVEGDVLKCWTK